MSELEWRKIVLKEFFLNWRVHLALAIIIIVAVIIGHIICVVGNASSLRHKVKTLPHLGSLKFRNAIFWLDRGEMDISGVVTIWVEILQSKISYAKIFRYYTRDC